MLLRNSSRRPVARRLARPGQAGSGQHGPDHQLPDDRRPRRRRLPRHAADGSRRRRLRRQPQHPRRRSRQPRPGSRSSRAWSRPARRRQRRPRSMEPSDWTGRPETPRSKGPVNLGPASCRWAHFSPLYAALDLREMRPLLSNGGLLSLGWNQETPSGLMKLPS